MSWAGQHLGELAGNSLVGPESVCEVLCRVPVGSPTDLRAGHGDAASVLGAVRREAVGVGLRGHEAVADPGRECDGLWGRKAETGISIGRSGRVKMRASSTV